MAVIFFAPSAQSLLTKFKQRISQSDVKGKITTWSFDEDGDFTHDAANWTREAWFRPVVSTDRLTFHIIKPANTKISSVVYAYYHGHLIETFLNHFDKDFSSGSATALPVAGDHC